MNLNSFLESFYIISKGIPITLLMVFLSGVFGLILAILVNVGKKYKYLNKFIQLYVVIFMGTPLFLQLFFIYYGFGNLVSEYIEIDNSIVSSLFKNAFIYALIALSLNTGAYGSVIIKAALDAIPIGQKEAAKALGLTRWQTFKRILLPQAFYYALPAYSNELILLVKASSLTSVITIMDITGYMKRIISDHYSFYEPFLIAAIYYLIINYSIIILVKILEKRANLWLNNNSVDI